MTELLSALLILNSSALVLYMTAWFGIGYRLKRLDVADTAWGGGFVLIALLDCVAMGGRPRALLITGLVVAWGLRLVSHIVKRLRRNKQDPRYTELSKKWKGDIWARAYFSIFLIQALLIWIVSLPIVVGIAGSVETDAAAQIDTLTIIGAAIWLVGFIFESIADRQLGRFVGNQKNKGNVLSTGLWRYSRHPNYFGELTQWWGIWLIVVGLPYGWWAIVGPLTITFLITRVSGIPLMEKRQKNNQAYREHKAQTSALIPFPPKARV